MQTALCSIQLFTLIAR